MGVGVLPGRMEGGVPVRGSTRGIGVAGVTAEVATEATPSDPLVAKRRDVHLDFFTLPPPPAHTPAAPSSSHLLAAQRPPTACPTRPQCVCAYGFVFVCMQV